MNNRDTAGCRYTARDELTYRLATFFIGLAESRWLGYPPKHNFTPIQTIVFFRNNQKSDGDPEIHLRIHQTSSSIIAARTVYPDNPNPESFPLPHLLHAPRIPRLFSTDYPVGF